MEKNEEIKKLKNHLSEIKKKRKSLEDEVRTRRENLNMEEMKIKAKLYDLEHS